jgi:signal-transduction protein with cAMP-binding, CBS, and nucleotidyltransferase domain
MVKRKEGDMSVQTILKGHEFFRHLKVEAVDKINSFSERKKFQRDEFVFKFEERADKVYLLLEGSVHLRLPARPEEFSIVIAKPEKDDLFGLSPLLGSDRYTLEAKCSEKSEVLAIDAKKFRNLLETEPNVGFYIMTEVARVYFDRYIQLLNRLQSIVLQIPLIP